VPVRESSVATSSLPRQVGFAQNPAAGGKNTVPHAVHRVPSSAGSGPVVNQPLMTGTPPDGAVTVMMPAR
jgi:hypothetical protein